MFWGLRVVRQVGKATTLPCYHILSTILQGECTYVTLVGVKKIKKKKKGKKKILSRKEVRLCHEGCFL